MRILPLVTAVGILASATSAFATVTLGPAVQPHGPGRVSIVWMDQENSPVPVVATSPGHPDVTATSTVTGSVQAAELDSLVPGVEYTYTVGDRSGRFIAPPDASQTLHFAVFGDSRTGDDVHRRIVQAVLAQRPDVFLTTGDDVESGTQLSQWQTFFEIERPLLETTAFTGVPGNHDVGSLFSNLVRLTSDTSGSSRTWGSLDIGPAHFVLVDGNSPVTRGSPQYDFIDRDLARNESKPLFVLLHQPLYSSGQHGGAGSGSIPSSLGPMFSRHGVDVVFQGHDHDYERTNAINGVTYFVTGGAGAPLYGVGRSSWTATSESVNHYMIIDASPTSIHIVTKRLDGTQLDTVDIDPRANNGQFTGTETLPSAGGRGCSVGPGSISARGDLMAMMAMLFGYGAYLAAQRTRRHAVVRASR